MKNGRLLNEIEKCDEEDENCIDFERMFTKCFQGKVVDMQHLREHYNRLRRIVPYYMLNDLQSIVVATKKELKKRMEKRFAEDDESMSGDWDEEFLDG